MKDEDRVNETEPIQTHDSVSENSSINLDEIETALMDSKVYKSPSEKGLRSEHLKWGKQPLTSRLLKVFNGYWSGGSTLSLTWIVAVVVVSIYKGAKTVSNSPPVI